MIRRGAASVLGRDLRRLGRRWGVRVVRMLVPGLVVFFLVWPLVFGFLDSNGRIQDFANMSFILVSVAMLFAVGTLIPLEIGAAVADERDEGALDLLVVAGRRPSAIVIELLSGRLLHVISVIAGVMPVFALILTLGGISPWQVVASAAVIGGLTVALTGVGLVAASAARGAVASLAISALWCAIFLLLIPLRWYVLYMESGLRGDIELLLAPMYAMHAGVNVYFGVAMATWCVAGLVGVVAGAWRMARLPGLGWAWNAKAWPGLPWGWVLPAAVVAVVWTVGELDVRALVQVTYGPNRDVEELVAATAYAVVWLLTHGLFLRTTAWLLPRLDRPRERMFRLGPPLLALFGPYAWKEVFTAGQGAMARLSGALTIGWMLVGALVWAQSDYGELGLFWAVLGVWAAITLGGALLALSITEERARRTLPLLVLTGVRGPRLLGGWALGSLVRSGPLAIGSIALFVVAARPVRRLLRELTFDLRSVDAEGFASLVWIVTSSALWAPAVAVVALALVASVAASVRRIAAARVGAVAVGVLLGPATLMGVLLLVVFGDALGIPERWTAAILLPPFTERAEHLPAAAVGLVGWWLAAVLAATLAIIAVERRMARGEH